MGQVHRPYLCQLVGYCSEDGRCHEPRTHYPAGHDLAGHEIDRVGRRGTTNTVEAPVAIKELQAKLAWSVASTLQLPRGGGVARWAWQQARQIVDRYAELQKE